MLFTAQPKPFLQDCAPLSLTAASSGLRELSAKPPQPLCKLRQHLYPRRPSCPPPAVSPQRLPAGSAGRPHPVGSLSQAPCPQAPLQTHLGNVLEWLLTEGKWGNAVQAPHLPFPRIWRLFQPVASTGTSTLKPC